MNTENPKLIPIPIPEGASICENGNYLAVIGAPNHPLASHSGTFPYHRFVLWQHLNQPIHSSCHWCGYLLPWKTSLTAAQPTVVNVDHLDADTNNNTPENLVPACYWCNVTRSWAEKCPEFWADWRRWMTDVPPAFRPNLIKIAKEQGVVPEDFKPESPEHVKAKIPRPDDDRIIEVLNAYPGKTMTRSGLYQSVNPPSKIKFFHSLKRLTNSGTIEYLESTDSYLIPEPKTDDKNTSEITQISQIPQIAPSMAVLSVS